MAKVLEEITLFVVGDPEEATPDTAFFSYNVVDGNARKENQIHEVDSPDFSDGVTTFWTENVADIKTAEGI